MIKLLRLLGTGIVTAGGAIAGGLVLVLMLAISFEVASRKLLGQSHAWVVDLGEVSLLFITFFARRLGVAGERPCPHRHPCAPLPVRGQRVMGLVTNLLATGVMLVVALTGEEGKPGGPADGTHAHGGHGFPTGLAQYRRSRSAVLRWRRSSASRPGSRSVRCEPTARRPGPSLWTSNMEWYLSLSLVIALLLALFASGLQVALVFILIDLLGLYFVVGGWPALSLLPGSIINSIASYPLGAVPLFVLMG